MWNHIDTYQIYESIRSYPEYCHDDEDNIDVIQEVMNGHQILTWDHWAAFVNKYFRDKNIERKLHNVGEHKCSGIDCWRDAAIQRAAERHI